MLVTAIIIIIIWICTISVKAAGIMSIIIITAIVIIMEYDLFTTIVVIMDLH